MSFTYFVHIFFNLTVFVSFQLYLGLSSRRERTGLFEYGKVKFQFTKAFYLGCAGRTAGHNCNARMTACMDPTGGSVEFILV